MATKLVPAYCVKVYLAESGKVIITNKKIDGLTELGETTDIVVNIPMDDSYITANIKHIVEKIDIEKEGEEA